MPPPDELPQGLMASLLDRLIDPGTASTAWQQGYTLTQLSDAVRRDLENLLNTRQILTGVPDDCVELRRSIAGYGLPDLTSLHALTPGQREGIAQMLSSLIELFEPRLRDVRAVLMEEEGAERRRTLKFRLEARLRVDPAPEVAFDTILELTTGHSTVTASERAAGV